MFDNPVYDLSPRGAIVMFGICILIAAYFVLGGYFCLPGGISLNRKEESKTVK